MGRDVDEKQREKTGKTNRKLATGNANKLCKFTAIKFRATFYDLERQFGKAKSVEGSARL